MKRLDARGWRLGPLLTALLVLELAGQPALDYDPEKLRELFEEGRVGQKVAFEIERRGKRKKLKIKLRDIL